MKHAILTVVVILRLQSEALNPAPAILSTLYGYDDCIGGVNNFDTDEEYMEDLKTRNCTVVDGPNGEQITNVVDVSYFNFKFICKDLFFNTEWMDGMPVTFNYPLLETPSKDAIELKLSNGSTVIPVCVTLGPALEQNEMDTLLILGQFGDGPINTVHPIQLALVGDVKLDTPDGEVNGKGITYQSEEDMNYLISSVRLVYARMWDVKDYSESQRYPTWPLPSRTFPNSCTDLYPSTTHVVRMAFSGGVTLDGVTSVLPSTNGLFNVRRADNLEEIPYLGLADLGKTVTTQQGTLYAQDGDNYLDICLDLKEIPEVLMNDLLIDLNCDEDGTMLYPPKGKPYGCNSQQVLLTSDNIYGYYIKMWE